MSDLSARLSLPYLQAAQAQKHVTHNEALERLDMLVQLTVQAFDATTPPTSPDEGQIWALGAAPQGDWAMHPHDLAAWSNGGWLFITPQAGWRATEGNTLRIWTGTSWEAPTQVLDNLPGLGINASHDSINRLTVASEAVLFTHEGAGHQLKINKADTADTASLLFQTGFSGRAEMGTAGNDDWSIKVSPDGAAWYDGMVVDRSSGLVNLPNGLNVTGTVTMSAPLPLAQGGTGAANAATARSNLDLGTAATANVTTSATDTTPGRIMKTGDAGLLANSATNTLSDFDADPGPTRFYRTWNLDVTTGAPPNANWQRGNGVLIRGFSGETVTFLARARANPARTIRAWVGSKEVPTDPMHWAEMWTSQNATPDGDGFLVEASPVLRLYADRIEEPTTPIGATMQRLGPGHYALTGCPPLATRGWQTRGAATCTVDHAVWVGDTLHVLTAVDGVQGDVPEGRFVMLRFWEPAEEGDEPPSVDAISQAEFEALLLAAYKRHVTAAIDRHIEAQARALGYNSAERLAGYVASTVPDWQAEAQTFVAWRDQIWKSALALLGSADPGTPPNVEAVIAALPAWPD